MEEMKGKHYRKHLKPMQSELMSLQRWVQETGQRLLVLFEGRDTAGKGGSIGAISDHLNPRACRIVALPKPTETEQGQWYFQRYVSHLPTKGEIVLFDRSWYNRAGVEKVMGFCTEAECEAFLEQAPVFEKQLVDDGIILIKYWLSVDQEEQEERFAERAADPLKRWKLSPIDIKAREKYVDYGHARQAMFAATHTKWAPWTVVEFNDQKRGRLNLIRDLLDRLPIPKLKDRDIKLPPLDEKPGKETFEGLVQPIKDRFGNDDSDNNDD